MASTVGQVRQGKACGRTPCMYVGGKSDQIIGVKKAANKGASVHWMSALAEWLERRVWRKGSCETFHLRRALYLPSADYEE